jgi:hypothetical protein
MFRSTALRTLPLLLTLGAASPALHAADDACMHFKWDITRERAVMTQTPARVTAAAKGDAAPALQIDKVYTIALAPQSDVAFVAKPAKPTLADGAHAGIVRFHVGAAGRYHIALTGPHWLDVLQNGHVINSSDFNGAHGCERPRKIVEYDFPADSDLILQLSGAADASVDLAIVPVAALPKS